MSSDRQMEDFEILQRKLRTECDEMKSQIQAIRNLLRRYRMMQGRRGSRTLGSITSRVTGFRDEYSVDTYHREPPYRFPVQAMLLGLGPLSAEDTLREIRDVLRR